MGMTTARTGGAGGHFQDPVHRERFLSLLPSRRHSHVPRQVHGNTVRTVAVASSCYPGCDGLVGYRAGQCLSVLTADCLPIFVRNRSRTRFALLHAGWRGLAKRILPRTLERYFHRPVDIIVGPGIGPRGYEVGEDVIDAVADTISLNRAEMVQEGILSEDQHLDLFAVARQQLAGIPVEVERIGKYPMTTDNSSVPLFSHRRSGSDERMLHWICPRE